ncbi:hypothetical protein [Acinetobacter guillouiae]|uniref:hypothetical protein n=1 Tax=Acinetobacter guillouiae TaxID=106649 RepID=UPI0030096AEE
MNKTLFAIFATTFLFTGCASVPVANQELTASAKQFKQLDQGKSGLYIYRTGGLGAALKKDIKINGNCIGETAPNVFFHEEEFQAIRSIPFQLNQNFHLMTLNLKPRAERIIILNSI